MKEENEIYNPSAEYLFKLLEGISTEPPPLVSLGNVHTEDFKQGTYSQVVYILKG